MTTSARRCAGCGGPLPTTPPQTRQLACPFCGIVNELAPPAQPVAPPVTIHLDVGQAAGHAARFGRTLLWIVLAIVVIVAGAVAIVVRSAIGPASEAVREARRAVEQAVQPPTAPARARSYTPEQLRDAGDTGWLPLSVAAPPTGWKAFEPVAGLEWALAIARGWQRDALLTRIDVDRVTPEGIVDLAAGPDNTAGYRFVSPSQIEEWRRIAERDSNARAPYELLLKLTQEKVSALVNRGRPPSIELPPAAIDSRPLPALLAAALKNRAFTEHPFYNGYMISLEREGWVWYLQGLSRESSLPRIRARDGAVWPYRR